MKTACTALAEEISAQPVYVADHKAMKNLKEITPAALYCGIAACPAIFEKSDGSYVIIGKKVSPRLSAELRGRIGANEYAIEVPKELIPKSRE